MQFLLAIYDILALAIAVFLSLFLFWRACRRDLVETQHIFDIFAVFALGTLFGRIADFFVRFDYYQWSFTKLVFFNVYKGFDLFGAFLGGLVASYIYLRRTKHNFWAHLDLAASPLAFGAFAYHWLIYIRDVLVTGTASAVSPGLYLTIGYFLIFWAIKRFEKKKKHKGFYACFYLLTFAALNLGHTLIFGLDLQTTYIYKIALLSAASLFVLATWYVLSKRKLFADIRTIFGSVFLGLFKVKRVFTSIREANSIAKAIVLSPLFIAKGAVNLVKYIGREIYLSIRDLLSAFGV